MSDEAPANPYRMTAEQFRQHGHTLIDWIADYRARVEGLPVLSQVAPGQVRAGLPAHPPEQPESFAAMMADVERVLLPGLTHWQSPGFFAYFPSNASLPSVLGDLLSSGLGIQGMLWATSPAATELETLVLDWLAEALDLPEFFLSTSSGGGVIHDTASSAVLCALVAARHRVGGGERLSVYTSNQAHSSIDKAVRIAGFAPDALRSLPVDENFALRPAALEAALAADRAAGFTPCLVMATVGTTSSMALDPLRSVGELARGAGAWFHVDGAMAGPAALCPELRGPFDGLGLADSYCINPHKWLLTAFDCTAFWVRERAALIHALSILPEYLKNTATASGAVIDYRDWQVPLGRRFRALKLWFVMRWYGLEGLRHHLRRHVELARRFASWVEADPRFELAAPVALTLVCFRLRGEDAPNERLLAALNAGGQVYLSHTKLSGRYVLRLALGQEATEERHVEAAWQLVMREAERALRP